MEKKSEVIKARQAIQISGNPSLLQRKIWTALLGHAYDELKKKDFHTIGLSELKRLIEYNSENVSYFRQTVGGLSECTVEWDILNKEGKKEWGKSSLLASVMVVEDDAICVYEFSKALSEKLHNPEIYAKLNLEIANRFSSKYTYALWEFCTDYKKVGSTGWHEVDKIKFMLGATSKSYKSFHSFNQLVLSRAIKELNVESDLLIEAEFQRRSRRIAYIRFLIADRGQEAVKTEKAPQGKEPKKDSLDGKKIPLRKISEESEIAQKIMYNGEWGGKPNAPTFEQYLASKNLCLPER